MLNGKAAMSDEPPYRGGATIVMSSSDDLQDVRVNRESIPAKNGSSDLRTTFFRAASQWS
jgi:hypothetical protein